MSAAAPYTFRASVEAIDASHPLQAPWHYDQSITAPRLERLEAKAAFYADYIEYLERRIAALEARLPA
ncbi:hypothetical protein ACFJGV_17330 [Cnuibacter sp. UC19_7]|uniref:hypothetical protein n=1 Tax=Cnuibacter sp. UC19_7 TaxID=3350166 RepID=UPI00366C1858